jgi:Glycosyltransferases involved in cell wall biogenesis
MSAARAVKESATASADPPHRDMLTPKSGLVSVIIPCYNQAHFLHEAIESALAQTYSHREIFVVDDGSTDKTAEVTARFAGVRYIRQENSGVSAARNTGLKESRGEYLVFLDADDRLLPEGLEIGVDCLRQRSKCAFAFGRCRFVTADGSMLSKPEQPYVTRDHYLELLRENYIWCPGSVIYRRSAFEIAKGFDTSLGPGADYDLYLRITRDSPVFCHNQLVAGYRLHSSSMSTDHSVMLLETMKTLNAQRDFVKGNDRYIVALETGKKNSQDYYRSLQMGDRILHVAKASLPSNSTVAVATGGKRELLRLGGHRAWHFPQESADERGRLFGQSAEGLADVHWIEAGIRYEFRLFGGPKYSSKLAAISVIGLADATPNVPVEPPRSGQAYLIAIPNPVPAPNRFGRTTITWNTGDGSQGRIYVSEGGKHNRCPPKDSDEAISHLEAVRSRGAEYLLLPATAFWWLDQYQKFRQYLETRYLAIVRDKKTCIIFDLRESSK